MENIFYILKYLLKSNNYNLSDKEIKLRLFSDSHQGILPLTNTLNYFKIEHLAAKVPLESLQHLPDSFIAQVSKNNQHNLVLVEKMNEGRLRAIVNRENSIGLSYEQFLESWTGLGIFIEKEKKNVLFKRRLKSIKNQVFIAMILVLLIISFSTITSSLVYLSFFLISLMGLGLGILIIQEKFAMKESPSKFCSLSGYRSCNKVLDSKQSRISRSIDLSDLVIIYFSFITITFPFSLGGLLFLILPLLSIPAVIYSVYQQAFVLKQWCPLCAAIGMLLIAQFLIVSINPIDFGLLINSTVLWQITVLMVIIKLWGSLRGALSSSGAIHALKLENLTFRRNHKLFSAYFSTLPIIDLKTKAPFDITIGSENPFVTLLMITNPSCKLCREAHHTYMQLLEKYPEELQIKIRFLVTSTNVDDYNVQTCQTFLGIYSQNPIQEFKEALNEFYELEDSKKWLLKWQQEPVKSMLDILEEQKVWCLKNKISGTPALVINGRLFPSFYRVKDITYFIETLITDNQKYSKIHA